MLSSSALRPKRAFPTRRTSTSLLAAAVLLGTTSVLTMTVGAPSANAATATTNLFGSVVPGVDACSDTGAVELGVQFSSDVAGQVSGVRFYKGLANTGTHTGSLWTTDGRRLASATFTSESASGWQTMKFAAPVSVTAGTPYIASYYAPRGRYAAAVNYFGRRDSGTLHATGSKYRYGGGYPTSTYQGTNYYVDVAFSAGTPLPPPTPTPTPVSTDFPGATNTGVPAGTSLQSSSSLTISTPNVVVDGLDVHGSVQINASNVTLRRSRVTTGSDWNVIRVADGVTGVRIEDVTVDGLGTNGTSNSMGIMGPATVVRANISGVENGFTPNSGSVLQDSWIHALGAPGSPHIDGVQIDGGQSNVALLHNTIDMREWSQTSAVMIDNYFGPIDGIRVDNNRLLGAGYTVYSDGQFSGGAIKGVSFTNNRFVSGIWGYSLIRNNAVTPVWTGNVIDGTTTIIGG